MSFPEIHKRLRLWARVRDLTVLRESARAFLVDEPAQGVACFLGALLERPVPPGLRPACLALVQGLLEPGLVPYERARELYEHADEAGYSNLCLVLVSAPPAEVTARTEARPRDPLFDELPLGTRKWKARLHDRNLLARLVHDPDPAVATILLTNPKVTEANVLRMASARPTRPEILLAVARSARWLPRPAVVQALVRNPYTPLPARVALLPLMTRAELARLRRNPTGHHGFDEAVARVVGEADPTA
jgi:hypothetical protein